MKPIEKSEGIGGMLAAFRKLVRGSNKITFIGAARAGATRSPNY